MGKAKTYTQIELVAQEYTNAKISAGFLDGASMDTMYIQLERDGEEPTIILLRPDEMAAIAYCASGTLWSELINRFIEATK
jgi:hypothetical protein